VLLRRGSAGAGVAQLTLAAALIFVPVAAAASSTRPIQTLTVLALVAALTGVAFTWFVVRQYAYVRSGFLGAAALGAGLASIWLTPFIRDFDGVSRDALRIRLLITAVVNALALFLFAAALRRMFPRRARGMAIGAIALVMVGVFPAPMLLVQPSIQQLNMIDVRPQLQAAFLYWTVGAALLVAPFLALLTLPGDWFERFWTQATAQAMAVSSARFLGALLILTFGLAIFITWYSFDARPTTADEIAQLWHARMLVAGHLSLPPDPNPEFFAIDNMIDRPHWMSQFPIGGPAVMAVGVLVGLPWLLNPVLTALSALNVYRFAQRAYGEAQARAAAVVFALSPMLLLMGGTQMNHTPTVWLVTLALAALPRWIDAADGRTLHRSAALIGVSLGTSIAIRPLDGVLASAVLGLVMLYAAARARESTRTRSLLSATTSGAVPVAALLVANAMTTGDPFRFGYEVLWGSNHSLGLHDDPTGHPHTAWRALMLGVKYATQLNWIVTAWPVPILLVVAAGMLLARRPNRWDLLLFALLGGQLLVYAFYWHDGQFIGPRFLFTALPPLLILTARAPFIAHERLRTGVPWRVAMAVLPVCIAVAWLRHMPPFGVQGLAGEFRTSRSRMKLDPPEEIQSGIVGNALVFVQEGAATRLLRRLWGVGLSRADAARLLERSDACTLIAAVGAEEQRAGSDTAGRLARVTATARRFVDSPARVRVPDPNFHVSSDATMTPACALEIAIDNRVRNSVAYGPMLLLNTIERDGRVGGPAVYVMNLGTRNEVLRGRFGSRRWYRYELPRTRPDSVPVLVPYETLP